MKRISTLRVVHRLMIEKPEHDPAFEDTELHSRSTGAVSDNYDFYPDFGI